MVRALRRAEFPVRVWNRNSAKAHELTDTGAEAFDTPQEAVTGADIVLTMLLDADAVIDVITEASPSAGTVWLQTSTVGIEGVERVVATARELGLVLIDCPVLGTKKPAEDGALVMLASGPDDSRAGVDPVLDALGLKTLWLGDAGAGTRLKLACNAWVFMVTAGVAQSIEPTRGLPRCDRRGPAG
jgi:3-hydroxyisobutyrate dehydrogenase